MLRMLFGIGLCALLTPQGTLWAAVPAPPAICVDLTGDYTLPLGKHDRTDDPPILMIKQDHCRLISVVIGYGGFVPIAEPSSLDGSEGFFIVGNSIVEKGSLTIPTNAHGQCSAQQVAMSLDSNKNLLFTSPRVSGCEDKYSGALHDTFSRVVTSTPAPAAPVSALLFGTSALTEVQRMQRVYAYEKDLKNPDQVPLDAVVLSYDVQMMYPPWYMQAFIRVSNDYEDLKFPAFDEGVAGDLYEQGKICSDKSVQCAAKIIAAARKKPAAARYKGSHC